jgi:hypothetical protein
MYARDPIRLATDFSSETVEDRDQWVDIFKVLKENKTVNQKPISGKKNFFLQK